MLNKNWDLKKFLHILRYQFLFVFVRTVTLLSLSCLLWSLPGLCPLRSWFLINYISRSFKLSDFFFLFISDLYSPPFLLISFLLPDSLAASSDSDPHPTGCFLPMPPGTPVPDAYPGLSNVPGLMMHNQENIFTAALRKFPSWFSTLLAWIDFHNCGGKPKMYKGSLFSEFISLNFSEWMWVCWKL